MTVIRLEVDSFKRLHAARVVPEPTGLVPVRGRNAQGKSSLIESMLAALQGKKAAPELPITEGAHGAEVIVDLGEIVVTRKWKRDSAGKATSSLAIEAADGSKISSPQAILDNLVGRFADPVAFLEMKADEQVKTILAVTGLDRQLSKLEASAEEAFNERRDLGRDAERLTKTLATLTQEVDGLPAPPSEGSVSELAAALQEAEAHNGELDGLEGRKERLVREGKALTAEIDALNDRLAKAMERRAVLKEEYSTVQKQLQGAERAPTDELIVALREHEEASKFAGRREMLEQTRREAEKAQAEHKLADQRLEALRNQIAHVLADADFPLPGMAYDAEKKQLLVNKIPFSNASQAERIKVAAAVAMAGEPAIRVMFAREGSLLDDESRAQLAVLAAERGFQLWLEVVDSEREGPGVFIEDGEAFQ